MAVIVEIEGLPSLKLGDNAYPFRNTISRQLTKEIFTLNLGSRVINEKDIALIDDTNTFKMEKLSMTDEVVAEFIKDVKLLNSLKQKVSR